MKHRKIESEIQELTQLLNKVVLERQEIEEKEEQIRNTIECLQATENESENKNKSSEKHKKRAAIPHNKLDKKQQRDKSRRQGTLPNTVQVQIKRRHSCVFHQAKSNLNRLPRDQDIQREQKSRSHRR